MKIICFKIRQCRKTNYKRKYEKNIKKEKNMEVNKLKEIQENLLICDKPSIYLEEIKTSLKNTPLEVLIDLEKIEQNKKYHPEGNVWNHLKQVVDTAAKIKDYANDKGTFMLGALLHDLGKGTTTKKNKQGRLISYNHDTEGEKIADKILTYYDYKGDEKQRVLNLVKYHMQGLLLFLRPILLKLLRRE